MRRLLALAAVFSVLAIVGAQIAPRESPENQTADQGAGFVESCRWVTGDLNVHSGYSVSDSEVGTSSLLVLNVAEQAKLAAGRELDFIGVTDTESVESIADPAFGSRNLVWIPGYETSFSGRVHLLGVTSLISHETSLESLKQSAEEVRGQGGLVQVAYPGDGEWSRAYGTKFIPDSVEVWIAGAWSYEPNYVQKDGEAAITYYDSLLDSGSRPAATGGSYSVSRSTTSVAGPGQPNTWVCAAEVSVGGVLEAIRSARTTISIEPPTVDLAFSGVQPDAPEVTDHSVPETKAPFAFLEADSDGDGTFESLVGDSVPPGSSVRVLVSNAALARWRVITDGTRILKQGVVAAPEFATVFKAPASASWARLEVFISQAEGGGRNSSCNAADGRRGDRANYCSNNIEMLALTSPVFIGR